MIVAFGTYDAARHPRIGILIDGLRAHGEEVVEVNHPLGLTTAERVQMLSQPWRLPRLGFRIVTRWLRLIRDANALRKAGGDTSTVLVGYLGHFDVLLARAVFPGSRIILDHLIFAADTAMDRGAGEWRVRLLRWLDARAISAADLVVVDTHEHAAMLPAASLGVVVPVGASDAWFASQRTTNAASAKVSAIFFGLFTPLQGTPVIARAIASTLSAGVSLNVTMVGSGQDWEKARTALGDHPDVTWLKWISPVELPNLVAAHDICFGIFGTSAKANRVVPNKVYEGMAAGCAVVTSDTRPQREFVGDGAIYAPAGDSDALAQHLIRLATRPEELRAARAASRATASQFRAASVVEPLISALRRTS